MKFLLSEFDVFYISYDEPKKEEFWAKLLDIAPWAKRIDGVQGFDNAHKAAALASETDRFITVDGDNLVFPGFFETEIEIVDDSVISWNSINAINGLIYGNGGLKLWTKDFVLNMKTHENAETDDEKLDFCWKDKYCQADTVFSTTHPNGSPFQAFRSGFREGVKMTLDKGEKIDPLQIKDYIWKENLHRLLIWASVGADVQNGLWAIYGTRLGIIKANIDSDFDMANISDYQWFKNYFNSEIFPKFQITKDDSDKYDIALLTAEISRLKDILQKSLRLNVADLNEEQSLFFKTTQECLK